MQAVPEDARDEVAPPPPQPEQPKRRRGRPKGSGQGGQGGLKQLLRRSAAAASARVRPRPCLQGGLHRLCDGRAAPGRQAARQLPAQAAGPGSAKAARLQV